MEKSERKNSHKKGSFDRGAEEEMDPSPHKRRYIQVGYEQRKELLEVINTEHLTIKSAAEKLNINYPTAKNIVKLYRREQRIEKLPKRPSLTINKITTSAAKSEDAFYRAALSPFYNNAEAERIMDRFKAGAKNRNIAEPKEEKTLLKPLKLQEDSLKSREENKETVKPAVHTSATTIHICKLVYVFIV